MLMFSGVGLLELVLLSPLLPHPAMSTAKRETNRGSLVGWRKVFLLIVSVFRSLFDAVEARS